VRLKLWDEGQGRLVTFAEAREPVPSAAEPAAGARVTSVA
jgi:hypothetical protein